VSKTMHFDWLAYAVLLISSLINTWMEARSSSESTADHCILHGWSNFDHHTGGAGMGGWCYLVYGKFVLQLKPYFLSRMKPLSKNLANLNTKSVV